MNTSSLLVEPARGGIPHQWHQFWRYRRFLLYFGKRFLSKRYSRTWLGMAWLPLRPGLSLGSRLLVFGGIVGITSGRVPYLVFFLLASSTWQLFAEIAYWATRSLEINRRDLRNVYIPRLVPLVASVVPGLVDYAIYLSFAAAAILYYYVSSGTLYLELHAATLLVLPGLLLIVLLGIGIGLVTSPLAARARDVRFGLAYVLSFWYYLTPVIYPITEIPLRYRAIASLNPMTAPVELVDHSLVGSEPVTVHGLLLTIATIVALFAFGGWWFARSEKAALTAV